MNEKKEKAVQRSPEENRTRVLKEGIKRESRHKRKKAQPYLYHGVSEIGKKNVKQVENIKEKAHYF